MRFLVTLGSKLDIRNDWHWMKEAVPSSMIQSWTWDRQVAKKKNTKSDNTKTYLESRQRSKMEPFVKIVNGFQPLTNFAKTSISEVWQDSEYASVTFLYHVVREMSISKCWNKEWLFNHQATLDVVKSWV